LFFQDSFIVVHLNDIEESYLGFVFMCVTQSHNSLGLAIDEQHIFQLFSLIYLVIDSMSSFDYIILESVQFVAFTKNLNLDTSHCFDP
jgi:hypothetical protein